MTSFEQRPRLQMGMDFWPVFFKESLGSPWVIQPEGVATPIVEPQTQFVFLSKPLKSDALHNMIQRMAVAVKLGPEDLSFIFSEENFNELVRSWSQAKRIMIFSDEAPSMGYFLTEGDQQIMWTHSLEALKQKTELKKETWEHLKKFVSQQ